MASPLSAIRSANVSKLPTNYTPVGVFVGGTSGIGQAMAEAFAQMIKGKATIVLVGRNKTAADTIIANLPKDATESTFEFVQCDVTLMRNVAAASKEILAKHPRINYLVLTPGFISMKGFDPSEEGIDRKLACHYYGRWKFINDLLPALRSAEAEGQDARVLSVMAASKGGAIDLEDLGLKKTYSVNNAALAAPTYNDLMMEVRTFMEVQNIHPDWSTGIRRAKRRHHLYPRLPRCGVHELCLRRRIQNHASFRASHQSPLPSFRSKAGRLCSLHVERSA